MESRASKYESNKIITRSSRNQNLYREVYGKYDNYDNLPVEDNTNEIDMVKLKELVLNSSDSSSSYENIPKENFSLLEKRKRNIDEQKLYDINKILEKAKYENNKLKENTNTLPMIDKSMLSTLRSSELSIPDIKRACLENDASIQIKEDNNLSMTRELKFHNLHNEKSDTELSLDLLSDLKPTGNTIVTEPIKEDKVKSDIYSKDTSDIDIIKEDANVDSAFFTKTDMFSKTDFNDDDDFSDLKESGGIFKIILLILAIFVFGGVITYFILNYGIGVS